MLSCKTNTSFFSSHLEMWIKLLHELYCWDLDQFSLTGIGMQRQCLLVICWLICLREQTIAYDTAQRVELLNQSFMYPTTWSIWNIWKMNTISLACKIQFLKTCPKEFIRFFSEWIVNLLQGNLAEKISRVVNYRDKIHELSLRRTTWKQRRGLVWSQKGFLLKKTISPFVSNHLSWDGTVCSSTSFCLKQQQQPNHCHKTRATQIQTWPNSQVPQRYVKREINQQLITSASHY